MAVRQNTGAGFFHPVTGVYVPPLAYYEGAAHKPHENVEVVEVEETTNETLDPQNDGGDETTDLTALSHNRLKQLAKEKGIPGYSTKSPDELIDLLKAGE